MEHLIEELKNINPDALHVVRTVLENRVGSAMVKTDNIELRSDVRRVYGILSKLIDAVRDEVDDEEVTNIRGLIVDDGEVLPKESESCAE